VRKDRLPFQQVVDALRGEILDERLRVGDRVPTQYELAERFDVSRATIQRALGELRDAGYIESHQGQGTFVADWREGGPGAADGAVRRPEKAIASLAKSLQDAFLNAGEVTIDAFSLTAETLNNALAGPLTKIRTGGPAPERIRVRLLLPSVSTNLAIPRSTADDGDLRPLERLRRLSASHRLTAVNSLRDLAVGGFVREVDVEVREVSITPLQKIYVLNGTEVLTGHYRIVRRSVLIEGESVPIYDVLGLGSVLFRHVQGEPGSVDDAFVGETKLFFDSLWDSIAVESAVAE
jgi:DNA-binding transcriptional regulator YhcF (GntR family)